MTVQSEQYLGTARASTSKYSSRSRWQLPVQSLLASRNGRRPNYKYAYSVISLPPVWLAAPLLLHRHRSQPQPSGRALLEQWAPSLCRHVQRRRGGGGGGGYTAAEETLRDVNNVLLKSSTDEARVMSAPVIMPPCWGNGRNVVAVVM